MWLQFSQSQWEIGPYDVWMHLRNLQFIFNDTATHWAWIWAIHTMCTCTFILFSSSSGTFIVVVVVVFLISKHCFIIFIIKPFGWIIITFWNCLSLWVYNSWTVKIMSHKTNLPKQITMKLSHACTLVIPRSFSSSQLNQSQAYFLQWVHKKKKSYIFVVGPGPLCG